MSRSMCRLIYQTFSIVVIVCFLFPNIQPASSAGDEASEVQAGGKEKGISTVISYKSQAGEVEFVPGVVLVGLKPGVSLEGDKTKRTGRPYITSSPGLAASLDTLQVNAVEGIFPQLPVRGENWTRKSSTRPSQVYRLRLPGISNVPAVVERLALDPAVEFAEPDYIARPAEYDIAIPPNVIARVFYAGATRPDLLTIDDPLYGVQWGLAKIDIEGAWDDTYGSPTVTIAVIDSGIQLNHPDLAAQLWVNPGEIGGNGLDDDSNGYIDDVKGWNFVASNNSVADDNGHGTLVSGVAAAEAGNGQGIAGVCPLCRIMPVKVMSSGGTANYSDIAAGVLYAAQKGARVINISLGGYSDSNTLRNAITTAVTSYNAVIVAGAGNDNLNKTFYPAAYPGVLAVAGTKNDDTKADVSNYGTWVDVSAPAVDIRTTALGGDWLDGSGTSMAAPFAAGLAGLLRSLHPDWDQALVRSQIVHTTDTIDSLNPGLEGLLGSGRLNASSAMQEPHPVLTMTEYKVNGETEGRPPLGSTSELTVTLSNDWYDAAGVNGTLSTADTNVTVIDSTAGFGNILAGRSKTNATPFTFRVAVGAGKNHPIPFTLQVTESTGYTTSFNFTVTTESGNVTVDKTITSNTTWTNNKSYIINANVGIAPGVTLTIQPGTQVLFNGNYSLNVGGTLIADGTEDQHIRFLSNTAGNWNRIFFDNSSTDAVADGNGTYLSGSILRYVDIQDTSGGIDCTTATPYFSNISLDGGGVTCSLGATPLWLLDSNITGNTSLTGSANAIGNTIQGDLNITGTGSASGNTIQGGSLSLGGSGGIVQANTVSGGDISVGSSYNVINNTVSGSLTTGNSATVDHNTAGNGISVGSSSTVTWNTVEGASGTGLAAGANITAQYNHLVDCVTGMTASTGIIEHNLIANNTGIGLRVGAATVQYNTLTGNQGDTIRVQGGNPVTIEYNNLEGNKGAYDLYVNIPEPDFVLAQHNWWGTTNNTAIAERIFDFNDDYTKAQVNFTLKLSEPDQTAPAYVRGVTVLPDTTLGIQTGTFEVEFSRLMDVNYSPSMQFYKNLPGSWSHFTPSNTGVPTDSVFDIAIDNTGKKWFSGAGILTFDGENWDIFTTENSGLPVNSTTGIAIDIDGTVWCGTYGYGVVSFDGTNWITYNTSNSGLPENRVWSIAIEADGTKWFGTFGGVASFDGTNWHTYNTSNSVLPANRVNSIAIEPNGTKWFGTGDAPGGGVASFDGTNWQVYTTSNSELPYNTIFSLAIDPDGTKWFGTYSGGVASFNGTNWMTYNQSNSGLPANNVWTVAIDKDGTKWFGTQGGGAASFDGINWKVYNTSNSGLLNNDIWTIEIEQDGTIWFKSYASSLAVRHGGVVHLLTENSQWLTPSLYHTTYDITSAIPKGTYRVSVSDAFDPDGMRIITNANTTFTVDYAGYISDKTPPLKPVVSASGNGSLTSLSASWSSSDPESPITMYRYAIGTSPSKRDVVEWTYTTAKLMTRGGLKLTAGVTYYVSAGARNEGGLWSKSGSSSGVVAGAKPGAFDKLSPVKGSVQPTNPLLKWGASSNVVRYEYCLDAEAVNDNVCDSTWKSTAKLTSVKLSGLTPNQKYFWQVRAYNLAGTTSSSGGWWSFTARNLGSATLRSQGANDGWVLESGENSNTGGSIDASATTIFLGDDTNDKQYRGLLSFDTSGLPNDAVILSAVLKIKKQGLAGSNPFSTHQGLLVDIKKPYFGMTLALAIHDFQAVANKSAVGTFGTTASSGWYSVTLLNTAYAYINKTGTTQFRLRFKLDDDNDNVADYMKFFSGNYGTVVDRPVLVIQYYLP